MRSYAQYGNPWWAEGGNVINETTSDGAITVAEAKEMMKPYKERLKQAALMVCCESQDLVRDGYVGVGCNSCKRTWPGPFARRALPPSRR